MPTLSQSTLFDFFDSRTFPMSAAVLEAIDMLASNSGIAARGAVFTRIEVVDFVLDLIGYTDNYPLYNQRILESSFGGGGFLRPSW